MIFYYACMQYVCETVFALSPFSASPTLARKRPVQHGCYNAIECKTIHQFN